MVLRMLQEARIWWQRIVCGMYKAAKCSRTLTKSTWTPSGLLLVKVDKSRQNLAPADSLWMFVVKHPAIQVCPPNYFLKGFGNRGGCWLLPAAAGCCSGAGAPKRVCCQCGAVLLDPSKRWQTQPFGFQMGHDEGTIMNAGGLSELTSSSNPATRKHTFNHIKCLTV